ncbi:MAG: S46 family peptidase [Bacteroidales bacterium]|nr:S46 family peptidase [Bacteroidales bacterium]
MRKSILLLSFLLVISLGKVVADEGMWLPILVQRLNYTDMQKAGLQLTAEEIYSVNHSSLKDAIVGLSNGPTPSGYFCTGEIVSDQGLIFTNHHCGYDAIQKHSTVEHDYLTDGFWAANLSEELPNPELSVSFLVRMEDVTDSVLAVVNDTMDVQERAAAIRKKTAELRKNNSDNGRYNVVVKSFFEGNEYYLFIYEVFTDVRLVGAPPSSVGKFGGDTDNWMWPRHTGDFSIFRVYCAPDGKPADYSPDNVPLQPKHHLPVSLDGVKKDDFTMIWGFPGNTDRYLTSFGVDFNLNNQYPAIIELLGRKLDAWKSFMEADTKVKIQYASKHASMANTWKYLIGQTRGLKRLNVKEKKEFLENDFTQWAAGDEQRSQRYGTVLADLQNGYSQMAATIRPMLYTNLAGLGGAEIIGYALEFASLRELLNPISKKDLPKDKEMAAKALQERQEKLAATIKNLREGVQEQFKDYYAPADQKVMAVLFDAYAHEMPFELQAEAFVAMLAKKGGNTEALAAEVFNNSIFASPEKVNAFLDKPNLKALEKDPALRLADSFMGKAMEAAGGFRTAQASLATAKRLFLEGLRKMQANKVFYPDANSTMRMTYGSVQDYYPADAIHYDYISTAKGILEKEDPTNDEFIVPPYLKELIEKQDFGPYADDNGKLIVCFLSTNDITGGNSGSPIINGKGELIGLAFDGNWEAMSGDIAFEPALQRTINVDVRYVLFIIDKYAGATRLIDELTIHKSEPKPIRIEKI